MQVKPSTLQSTLCTTSNTCESATNCNNSDQTFSSKSFDINFQLSQSMSTAIQTSTILKAKRCTNHDRKKISGNALDDEELPKKGFNTINIFFNLNY
jgi:hypothetical protein